MATIKPETVNIVLITIDCLRADHVGGYGYPKNVSPCIDRIASEGTIFLNAVSHGGGTPEAFPSILASVPPPLHTNEYKRVLRRSLSIAEILKENGYHAAAFHSNPYLSRYFYYHKGFHFFEDGTRLVNSLQRQYVRVLSELSSKFLKVISELFNFFTLNQPLIITAEEITNMAVRWLKNVSGKFFLWLHYMDVHSPCMPPTQYLMRFSQKPINRYEMVLLYNKIRKNPQSKLSKFEREMFINVYDASIRYVDDAIRLLRNELAMRSRDTLIIITSDHGEAFGEHGVFGHSGFLYDEIIHIPLIISGPGIKKGDKVRRQVSLMDVPPTIVDLLKFKAIKSFHGESLIPVIEGRKREEKDVISVAINPSIGQRAISCRTGMWKYICTERTNCGKIRHELYNLEEDPGETANLSEVETERVKTFRSKIARYKSLVKDEKVIYEKKPHIEENELLIRERLKALGYIN